MKLPTWALIVGIMMLLFGGCGALNNVQKIYTSEFLENTELISEISESIEADIEDDINDAVLKVDTLESGEIVVDSSEFKQVERVKNMVDGMFNVSDFYKKWIKIIGIVGTVAAIIYAIAGLILLLGKRYSIKVAYAAIAVSLASAIFQLIIYSVDDSSGLIAMSSRLGVYFVIIMNIILGVIIVASDKTFFEEQEFIEE